MIHLIIPEKQLGGVNSFYVNTYTPYANTSDDIIKCSIQTIDKQCKLYIFDIYSSPKNDLFTYNLNYK